MVGLEDEWHYRRHMADCGCGPTEIETKAQQRALWLALVLNAVMFFVEVASGLYADSTSLVADGLDMLTDASVYAVALMAIGRSNAFKARAATLSGALLLIVGIGVVFEAVRRVFVGAEPVGVLMIIVALVALAVNTYVLRLLQRQRSDEVHMRAAWIFTRADVVANVAVIVSGASVLLTGVIYFDLLVGAAIGLFVMREAMEILREARQADR
ncbi:cation diffusion facilitator family transporter [Qipengyuania xiamenensis]|uniref:cation diffusion facilitator family transporter n=1 Tax=Qipengyuania xiamenensis TaxID=2867237 RepID=UPI001FFCB184|nr:cation diffusion facilitator family transporter [Qipengyuania xiamenensis]